MYLSTFYIYIYKGANIVCKRMEGNMRKHCSMIIKWRRRVYTKWNLLDRRWKVTHNYCRSYLLPFTRLIRYVTFICTFITLVLIKYQRFLAILYKLYIKILFHAKNEDYTIEVGKWIFVSFELPWNISMKSRIIV